eukprot:1126250-Lingulodinium_polyedra.AAC.1
MLVAANVVVAAQPGAIRAAHIANMNCQPPLETAAPEAWRRQRPRGNAANPRAPHANVQPP